MKKRVPVKHSHSDWNILKSSVNAVCIDAIEAAVKLVYIKILCSFTLLRLWVEQGMEK